MPVVVGSVAVLVSVLVEDPGCVAVTAIDGVVVSTAEACPA